MRAQRHMDTLSHVRMLPFDTNMWKCGAVRMWKCAAVAMWLCLPGCLERTITVTSTPPGALVCLNGTEVGRTPVTTAFTFYGDFDVQVRKEGYEPLLTHKKANAPIYEYAPFDLAATAWPGRIRTDRHWHFDLVPLAQPTREGERSLVERAGQLRSQIK